MKEKANIKPNIFENIFIIIMCVRRNKTTWMAITGECVLVFQGQGYWRI